MKALLLLAACLATQAQSNPWVAGFVPRDGATGVPLNARLLIALNFPRSVHFAPTLLKSGTPQPGATEFLDRWVVFTPNAPLEPYASYEFRISDFEANPLQVFTCHFTTGAAADTEPLALTASEPADGQDAANLRNPIRLHFNKPLNPLSMHGAKVRQVDLTTGYSAEIVANLLANGTTLQLDTYYGLPMGHAFRIYLPETPVEDWTGHLLPVREPIRFTTYAKPPEDGPRMVSAAPSDGDSAVPTNSSVLLLFDRPLTPTLPDGVFTLTSDGAPAAIQVVRIGERGVALNPKLLLSPNKDYKVTVSGLTDIYGRAIQPSLTLGFHTGLLPESRQLTFSQPSNKPILPVNASPALTFNRALDPTALAMGGVFLQVNQASVPIRYQLSADRRTILVTPEQPFLPGAYSVRIQQGYERFQKTSQSFAFEFSIRSGSETEPAQVLAVSPPDGTPNAPTNALVEVVYDRMLDPARIAESFRLTGDTGTVAGQLSVIADNDRTKLTFRPTGGLTASSSYRLVVDALTDFAGNATPPVSAQFTTAASNPAGRMQLLSVAPGDGAVVTDPLAPIHFTFDRSLSPVGPTEKFFTFLSSPSVTYLAMPPGKTEISGTAATFTPSAPLSPGQYFIRLYALTDLSGDSAYSNPIAFTVLPQDSTPLARTRVAQTAPEDGGIVSPARPVILLTFSNPVTTNTLTIGSFKAIGANARISSVTAVTPTQAMVEFAADAGSLVTMFVTSDVLDYGGDPVVPFQTTVRLGETAAAQGGRFVRARPTVGASEVRSSAPISLMFDAPVDRAAMEASMAFAADGRFVTGGFEWTPDLRGVTFVPDRPWPGGSQIDAQWAGQAYGYHVAEDTLPSNSGLSLLTTTQSLPTDGILDVRPGTAVPAEGLSTATCSWGIVPGSIGGCTISFPSNGVVRLRPDFALRPNTDYGVTFEVGSYPVSFHRTIRTASGPALPHPVVSGNSPISQPGGVPLNAIVGVAFSSPVSGLGMPGGIRLSANGEEVPVDYSWSGQRGVQVTPRGFLRADTEYTVTVDGFVDLTGRPVAAYSWTFVTGTNVDASPFDILRLEPAIANADPRSVISMVLSKQVDVSTAAGLLSLGNEVLHLSDDHRSFRIEPASDWLAYGHNGYGAQLLDIGGNGLAGGGEAPVFGFGHPLTAGAPVLVTLSPADGLDEVPLNAQIQVKFDRQVLLAASTVSLLEDGVALPAQAKTGSDGRTVSILPAHLPKAGALLAVRLEGVSSADGLSGVDAIAWSFRLSEIPDFKPPTYRAYPVNGATIPPDRVLRLRFNERLSPLRVSEDYIALRTDDYQRVVTGISLEEEDRTVVVRPLVPLTNAKTYTLSITQVTDLAGNIATSADGTNQATTFSVGQGGPVPALVAINPPDGSESVAPEVTLQAVYSGPVDLTLGDDSLRVTWNGEPVEGTLSLPRPNLLYFKPKHILTPGAQYWMELKGLTGMNGDPLPDCTARFTVRIGGDYGGYPRVTSVSPAAGAQDVPVTSSIVLNFEGPVNPAWVALTGMVQADAFPIIGAWRVEGPTATFEPAFGLPPASSVSIYSAGSIGTIPGLSIYYSFTTAAAAAAGAPAAELESTWPAKDSLVPAQSTRLVARFTNPVFIPSGVPPMQLLAGTSDLSPAYFIGPDGRTLWSTVALPADRQITWSVGPQLKDLTGRPVKAATVSFRTMTAEESAAPGVKKVTPESYTYGVPVTTPVVLEFSTAMDPESVPPAVFVADDGTLVAGSIESDESAKQFRFTPTAPFGANRRIDITVEKTAHDRNGLYVPGFSSLFTTAAAAEQPKVVAAFATSLSIDLKYSGSVSAGDAAHTLRLGGTVIPVSVEQGGSDWLRLTPESPLTAGTTYQLLAGTTQIAVTAQESSTGEPLQVESITAGDDGFLVRFNQAVNPITLDRQRIRLLRPGGVAAKFGIWVGTDQRSVRLVPEAGDDSLDLELEGIETPGRGRLEFQRRGGLRARGAFHPAHPGNR